MKEHGVVVDVASIRRGRIRGKHGYEIGAKILRKQSAVLEVARAFMAADKIVAAICHGLQILVSASVMRGGRATCFEAVAAELRDAGVLYEDREVIVDGNLYCAQAGGLAGSHARTIKRIHARVATPARS